MSRTRRRSVPDWHSQFGNYIYQEWMDPTTNNGTHPVQTRNKTGLHPNWDSSDSLFKGQQVTVDETHGIRNPADLRGQGAGDVGGDFYSQIKRAYIKGSSKPISFDRTGTFFGTWVRSKYDGPCLATTPDDNKFPVSAERNLGPLGTTAIARCKPTNNVVNLATTVAETVRDGLPHILGADLWKGKTSTAKSAGSEYLNYEFGWLPLVGDIRGASYAIANAHRLLKQYERNSGRQVRRRYEFPVERTESNVLVTSADGIIYTGEYYPGVMYDASKPMPLLNKRTTFYRRTWFSGSFTYHLPVGYKSRNWLTRVSAEAGPLLGLELTPEVVWNAAPWTWAIDWFSNLGDVVSNVSDWSTDGLVMRYGYIMEHTLQEVEYRMIGPTRYQPWGTQWADPITFSLETKRRRKATPFGFEATWNTLTPRQLAIAAALGITRVFS